MSVIAVDGVPFKMSLMRVIKQLAKTINGHFEALNFVPSKKGTKTCYLRLSEKLDPLLVIERINMKKTGTLKPYAYMPKHVPDLQLATRLKTIPTKMRRSLRIPISSTKQLIAQTHSHVMREMQTKYTGLYELNKEIGSKGHSKLLHTIGQAVYKRLVQIRQWSTNIGSVFLLSKSYRKKHPHFGDFQLILSSLHQLQDAEGKPRIQLQESELTAIRVQPYMIDNIPYDKVKTACNKYLDKITNKVTEHIKNLSTKVNPDNDCVEEAARIKVREQMNKLAPYMPSIINQVVNKHFIPQESSFYVVRIYGEPKLPGKDVMRPWLRRHRAVSVTRDMHMFNLLTVRAPRDALLALLAADGTLVGGSKLVIRPSDVPFLRISLDAICKEEEEAEASYEQPIEMETDPTDEQEWNEQW